MQLAAGVEPAFAVAAQRLRGLSVVAPDTTYDAIVTDSADTARTAAEVGRCVLLHLWDVDQVRSVDQACKSAGVILMPSHPWRYRPSVEALVQAHRDGKLGAPGLVRIHRWCSSSPADITLHTIMPELDVVLWIFGGMPETVYAPALSGARFFQVHLGFADGGMALVDFAPGLPQGASYESHSLIGATGAAYADDHHNISLLYTGGTAQAMRVNQDSPDLGSMLRAFVSAVEQRRSPEVTAADTIAALRTAETALKAAGSSAALSPGARP